MTTEQLQQAIEKEEKALTEFLERANTEAAFRRGRIAALKDMHATTQEAQPDDEGGG
jgi:hypothetical protein